MHNIEYGLNYLNNQFTQLDQQLTISDSYLFSVNWTHIYTGFNLAHRPVHSLVDNQLDT